MVNKKIINYAFILFLAIVICACNGNSKEEVNRVISHSLDTNRIAELQTINYSFDPSKDAVIKCKQGTLVYYYSNSLVTMENEAVKDSVAVEVGECYEAPDFIKCKVTTHYDGGLLQTGGAVYLNFKRNGKELKIKDGKFFQIGYPKRGKRKEMKLYEGERKNGYVIWNKEINQKEIDWSKNYASETGMPQDTANYYIFTSRLNYWHNCDFMMEQDQLTPLALDLDTLPTANVLLVFPKIKSVCAPLLIKDNYMQFGEVAMNTEGILFGYTEIDGVYYYCKEDLFVKQKNQIIKPRFIKSTKEEVMTVADGIKWNEEI